jgi:hypothetical protein
VNLSKVDVSGTSTDSLLVISNALHEHVVSKQTGTIQACNAKSCAPNADAKDVGNRPSNLIPAGQTCIIEQVCYCLLFSSFTLVLSSVMLGRVLLAGHSLAILLLCHGIVCCRSTAGCRMSVSHALLPQRSWVVWCCKPCSDRFARLRGYLAGYQQSLLLNHLLPATCMHLHACTA